MTKELRRRFVLLLTIVAESREPVSTNDEDKNFTEQDIALFAELHKDKRVTGFKRPDGTGQIRGVYDMTITARGRDLLNELTDWKKRNVLGFELWKFVVVINAAPVFSIRKAPSSPASQ